MLYNESEQLVDQIRVFMDAAIERGLIASAARAMAVFASELEGQGFTRDEAIQLVLKHGTGVDMKAN